MSWTIAITRNDTGIKFDTQGADEGKLNSVEMAEMTFYMEMLKKSFLEAATKIRPPEIVENTHAN
jgi:hypothetical protein